MYTRAKEIGGKVMAVGEKMILKTPVCQLLFYFF